MAAIVVIAKNPRMKAIGVAAASIALIGACPCLAQDPATRQQMPAEIAGDSSAQWYDCGCYDEPSKHYPYSIVVFKAPERDLVTRPERREGALTFSPLAVRYGTRYCAVELEQNCYGSFSHPCDFTDFRYGPTLAEYFPTCKAEGDDRE
jgi:hypothetical protein